MSGPYSSSSAVPSLLLCTSTVRMYLVAVLMGVACSAACYEGKAAAARAATRRLVPPPPTMTTPLLCAELAGMAAQQQQGEEGLAVFVSNLQWWTTDAELEQLCAPYGAVAGIRFIEDKACGKSRGMAVVDIFRIVDGQFSEHWDVLQEVPRESANPHTMF